MDRKKQWGDRKEGEKEIGAAPRQRVRRSSSSSGAGSGGGCSEGCWQHRLLSRCYIEWVDEYLRRSTSCGFFFNQANLLAPLFPPSAPLGFPILLLVGFPLAQIMARSESRAVYADRGREVERERENLKEFATRRDTVSVIPRRR